MIKESTIQAIDRYANDRCPPGGFVRAVLENNLTQAYGYADAENFASLKEIVKYCYWEIPGDCWGSPEKVRAWLNLEHE